jgi:DnaJ-class molecular chaperone
MRVICDECRGRGKVSGLGYVLTHCDACDGKGMIEVEAPNPAERVVPRGTLSKGGKRGRPFSKASIDRKAA